MTHEEFNQFCRSLPNSTYVMQWNHSHVWKIGGKVFAIGSTNKQGEPAFTFKTSAINFDFLREEAGYIPAPYFASRGMKWIQQLDTSGHLDEDLKYYLSESYRLVFEGLTKAKQAELQG
ncbi:MmcQ/YjbR family DNA-binding protein [Vibrio gangliei]|uniref:MmcQ/YjbR family DNA-binding protein n=1 Tax=Vibrio gangliei TaxID=2077090 RepID=UPI000D01DFF0|nr:MmcQ/YjbR family DNA-binding protein [Vibrio gangliei]